MINFSEKQARFEMRVFIQALQPSSDISLFFHPEHLEIAKLILLGVEKQNKIYQFFGRF